jgi:hypothetical protein
MLRIPRRLLGADEIGAVTAILTDMATLRESIGKPQPVGA